MESKALGGDPEVSFTFNVTLAYGAPSCFARPIVLVNGMFEPAVYIHQGDVLKITLVNNLPASYPGVSDGISIHYHGLHMGGPAAWFDGASYISLCPITAGSTYTYQFKVNDPPGTYLWHDHAAGFKGDGLQGPLIVRPRRAAPMPPAGLPPGAPAPSVPDLWQYDDEHIVFLSDWYHATMNSLMFRLNMPFDAAKVTNDSGSWNWIGNPQALLINGRGFYGDCPLFAPAGANPTPPVCAPTSFTVPPGRSAQQPWASNNNPGCTHERLVVQPGKRYRLRIIGASTLVYMTLCFEGHNVTLLAADAMPVAPVSTRCVDVNSGQRLDVLLTADQPPANYWIAVAPQYRVGSPAGYAVLSYEDPSTNATVTPAFPTTPAPQIAAMPPWSQEANEQVVMAPELLVPSNGSALAMYRREGQPTLAPPKSADKLVVVNLTQPLLENGQLRWALGNVAMPKTPPCSPLMNQLRRDPAYLTMAAVPASTVNGTGAGPNVGIGSAGPSRSTPLYLSGVSPAPLYPSVGLNIVQLEGGQVVDVILNNRPANENNGDYRPNGATRNATEQHPFHLHGHRFWVLGRGTGSFSPELHGASLNTANPPLRDTVTVAASGWAYLRFRADNPGVWPFHCHILPHIFMGQQATSRQPLSPEKMYNFAPYTKSWLRAKWGLSGWELPPLF
ncbi:hypothetical protein GPECTOR_71g546 [Gonium pectorale]|uniref:Laccase n=1 Tax=Gonium pectorale TaxID=33097 RepID=A0A150G3U1_GONPE|nr:hypothetical protein GPECTOR_71g546 [Gonium pectorale]|eukprot:KXZ44185.1 hypothetical protein GPECTOR_71g546 [Gonium pectorale]